MSRYSWLIDNLIRNEYVEDAEHLTKEEAAELLASIVNETGKKYDLIIHINIETDGIYYDYVLDSTGDGEVLIEEWDNR